MLRALLSQLVRTGTLTLIWPNGRRTSFGQGTPRAAIRVHDWGTVLRLQLNPDLAFGEAYMDGRVTVEEGDLATLFDIVLSGARNHRPPLLSRLLWAFRHAMRGLAQFNPVARAKANVAHHYDLSDRFYELFLDADRQYSCAYFQDGDETLERAQAAKKRHIAAKLHLDRPGLKVLDIGAGWGGLALDLARDAKADVLGITLSKEQLAYARARAHNARLAPCCRFELEDYRNVKGQFDRIVSVGMFEHVGITHYGAFFRQLRDRLAPDGVALLHTIGRLDGPGATSPWINKYIFPGGYSPALSEILPFIEKSDLIVTDVEVLRLHYAETLKSWGERFRKNRAKAAALYDERFCRMWEFYLASAEMSFRHWSIVVFQIQLAKSLTALPLTRDYMNEAERSMQFAGVSAAGRANAAA